METLKKRSFFVLASLLAVTTLRAQTVDEIVNKYVEAVGGKDAVNNVKTLVMFGSTDVQGNSGNTSVTLVVGQGYKSELDFGDTKIINCYTPTQGWGVNPFMGATTPTAMPDAQLKAMQVQLQLDPLANYATLGYKVEMIGKDTADYKLKLTGPADLSITLFINQKTYLVDKSVRSLDMGGQQMDITVTYSDYRKLDGGPLFPYTQSVEYPQATLTTTFKTITVNSTVDPSVFVMPKS